MAAKDPTGQPQQIVAQIQAIADSSQMLVREEIELAKTEVTEKVAKLARGAGIGAAAGIFVLGALLLLLQGLAWLAWYLLPIGNNQTFFWGFFFVALVFLILAAIAAFIAAKVFKRSSPPKPEMAIAEAQRIRETVAGTGGGSPDA